MTAPALELTLPSGWRPLPGACSVEGRSGDAVDGVPLAVHGHIDGRPVHAVLTTRADPALADHDLDDLATELAAALHPIPHDVSPVDLPLGRALRLRTRVVRDGAEPQAVVVYLTPPLDGTRVVLTFCTGSLASEAALVRTFDEIALTLHHPATAGA